MDESTDISKMEQVSVCVRYLRHGESEVEVCEVFLGFFFTDAEHGFDIVEALWKHLTNVHTYWKLHRNLYLLVYPCAIHTASKKLVIVASCNNVPDVRNFMSAFKELTFFSLIHKKGNIF